MGETGATDVLGEALEIIDEARSGGIPVRLVGGMAVRYLTPGFPPRERSGQDLDLASVGAARPQLSKFLEGRGYVPDKSFNALYGHKQMYFTSRAGRAMDVLIDKLEMCHVLEFKDRIDRMSHTLDPCDLLLSKLQIVQLNEKDAQDAVYLVSAFPVAEGDEPGTIGLGPFSGLLADDWGWWRTVTMNLDRISTLITTDRAHLVPAAAAHDPVAQLGTLRRAADEVPKSFRWKLRARLGDRVKWYQEPEETEHY